MKPPRPSADSGRVAQPGGGITVESIHRAPDAAFNTIRLLQAEVQRYREAIEIALPALEGESGLPFTDPYPAARTAAEALSAASRKERNR